MNAAVNMNDIRRGNPKKRFLWRRLLPGTHHSEEEESNDEASNHNNNNNNSLATQKLKDFYLKRIHERPRDFRIASPVISPPLSEEDEDSSENSNSSRMLSKTTSDQAVESPPMRQSSGETSGNEVSTAVVRVFEQQLMSCQMSPRPFLASIDSPLGLRQPIVHQSSTEVNAATKTKNKKTPTLDKDAMDQSASTTGEDNIDQSTSTKSEDIEEVEAETFEKTRLVLSTAASVLLLMRFSVTDQALSSLTRGKGSLLSENKTIEGQKEQVTENEGGGSAKAATPSSPPLQAPSPKDAQHVVSPEIAEKPCIMRRVSLEDPITPECPNRLAMPEDPNELNSLHCFVRAHLLEVFSLPPQKDKPGRVGLRCVFCSHLPRKDRSGTTMCRFYPKSLQDLYRSVMTWQRIHFRSCKHVIPKMKEEYWKHKESDQTRGKTTYWVTSAMRLGLQDINNGRNGICFVRPLKPASTRSA